MEEHRESQRRVPHVLIFPYPAQGHINSMLRLAKLLSLAGIHVSFLNSDYNHRRLLQSNSDLVALADRWPGFRFLTISDGLPLEHSRSAAALLEVFDALNKTTRPLLRDMLASDRGLGSENPMTCVIADGILSFAIEIGEELRLPVISFRTISACAFWCYFCIPRLAEAGELPFEGEDFDLDRPIKGVPGMENFLRRRDLPSFCRTKNVEDQALRVVWAETQKSSRAWAQILNTFEDLEGPILAQIRAHCPRTYTIGPLHALLRHRDDNTRDSIASSSLWSEDRSCTSWLDRQPPSSVLYVSFGSYAVVSDSQLLEFWHGLAASRVRFLWVMRPDLVDDEGASGGGDIPAELAAATRERGYLVKWAPQEEVLSHPAVGGFLTHSGWNSTLESVFAGVPMICWAFFADQQVNSRFVSEVWGLGLDMKDTCDRARVERMVRELMEVRREEFCRSSEKMSAMARKSIGRGGSSHSNLEKLIEDIRAISSGSEPCHSYNLEGK